jgi:hypothetical protein
MFWSLEAWWNITNPKKTPFGNQIMSLKFNGRLDHPLQSGCWCAKSVIFGAISTYLCTIPM